MIRWGVVVIVALAVAGCGQATATGSTVTATGTPQVEPGGSLTVTVDGRPQMSFIVYGGHWRVCDHGSVTNSTTATAHDVHVLVTYLDHGRNVGSVGVAGSAAAGGALGDIASGASHDFTVCGLASEQPDSDQVSAVVGS